MKKADLNYQELRLLLQREGVIVRPQYSHEDYIFTSFTMPHPLKKKLDTISKKYNVSRSKIVQMLLSKVDVDNFLNDYLE